MASERLSRALMTLGEGFGRVAEVAFTREREQADRIHRESLARLSESKADARQERAITARSAESEADRTFSAEENRKDRELTTRRLDDADRRAIESQAQGMLADVDDRMIKLRDKLMDFKVEGMGTIDPEVEQQIMQEMQGLHDSRRRIQFMMVEQLAAMGDPRYEGMDKSARALHVGYAPEEVEALLRMEQEGFIPGGGDKEAPSDEPAPTADPSTTRNPNAINADEIIERPSGRRRRRPRLSLGTDIYNEKRSASDEPLGGTGLRDFLSDKFKFLMEPGGVPGRAEAMQRPPDFYAQFDDDFFERRGKGSP